jgi:molybdopterin converting factor small subunit
MSGEVTNRQLTIKLFAAFREVVGEGSLGWTMPAEGNLTAGELLTALIAQYPGLSNPAKAARIMVNRQYATLETRLAPGDEVAFIPPIGGGA